MPGCFYDLSTSPDPYWKEGPARPLVRAKCSGIAGQYDSFIPSFLKNIHTVLHSVRINLHSHQQCKRVFSTSLPAFIVCRFFDDGHFDWCEKRPHCSFDLNLSKKMSQVEPFFFHVFNCSLVAPRCADLVSPVSLLFHRSQVCVPSTGWGTRCVVNT